MKKIKFLKVLLTVIAAVAFFQISSFSATQNVQAKVVSTPKALRGSWYIYAGEAGPAKLIVTKKTVTTENVYLNTSNMKWKATNVLKYYTNTAAKSYHRVKLSKSKNGYYKFTTYKSNTDYSRGNFYLKSSRKKGHKILMQKKFVELSNEFWPTLNLLSKYG